MPRKKPLSRVVYLTPIHPGETLKDELIARNMSAQQLALKLRVPANRITSIINGTRSVTPETALRLSKFFGTSPEFWMNLQSKYDLTVCQNKFGTQINMEVQPANTPGFEPLGE